MRRFMLKRVVILLCMAAVLTGAAAAQVRTGQTVYVTARSLPLKSGTGFFARTVGTLVYGDAVTVLQVNGKWAQVESGGRTVITGWTAQTNLTTKRIVAAAGTGSASSREVAMAGKGFNEEVESVYRETSSADFDAVDLVEANRVSDEDLLSFISEGRLSMGDE
jgi:uncharacterized protein YgiM (DUF1202 family)